MASAMDKVVKVENVSAAEVHFSDEDFFGTDVHQTGPRKSRGATDLLPEPTIHHQLVSVSSMSSDLGTVPPLYPPPEGWPDIPQLHVKQSWDFSTAASPCVNKATAHLELLQTIIDEWCAETEMDSSSRRTSKSADVRSEIKSLLSGEGTFHSSASQRKHLRFVPKVESPSSAGVISAQGTSALSVHGVGAKMDAQTEVARKSVTIAAAPTTPYLGAQQVIDEVITLLARFELDRREAKLALEQERARVARLATNIDDYAHMRLEHLPVAVQKEHEACARDISELNWHVSHKSRAEEKIERKVDNAQNLNVKLKEDIAFIESHCPLVKEKLDLELGAMEKIEQAQQETQDELTLTLERCGKAESKSAEAHAKAKAERAHIKKDLDSVKADLVRISEELADTKRDFNHYIHQANEFKSETERNRQETLIIEVKLENSKAATAMAETKVEDLQDKVSVVEQEQRILRRDNEEADKELEEERAMVELKTGEYEKDLSHKKEQLRLLKRKNQELQLDIDDVSRKLSENEKQRKADEKNLARMRREIENTEEQLKVVMGDLAGLKMMNEALKDKLKQEEAECVATEENLRSTAEALRKQIKEEIHSKTMMQARIVADTGEESKLEKENISRKEKIGQKVDEVDIAVTAILDKVTRLRAAYAEKLKRIAETEEEEHDMQESHSSLEMWRHEKLQALTPTHTKLKDRQLELTKRLDHMQYKTGMMQKKMEDMDSSSSMMDRSIQKSESAIYALEKEVDELQVQIESEDRITNDLQNTYDQLISRAAQRDTTHRKYMEERNQVLEDFQERFSENFKENREMAARYRKAQNEYLYVKSICLNQLDQSNYLELAIRDIKQVQGLQVKMHAALQDYHKYRSLFNQAALEGMEDESIANRAKVKHLRGEMNGSLDHITTFLKEQMDDSTNKKQAMDKVLEEEASELASSAMTPGTSITAH